jgi:transcriptional regulator with XRE-family HTH domain
MPTSALGAYIQKQMTDRGWSQLDLKAHSGVSPTTIRRIINGEMPKKHKALFDIARALNVDYGYLLTLAGYSVGASPSSADHIQRLAVLLSTFDWAKDMMEDVMKLTPDRREAVIAVVETMARQQGEGEDDQD